MVSENNISEVCLFGPGFGESVLLRLASDCWVVVDSCVHPQYEDPTPLRYLRDLGVNLATDVRLIVISHWHDDHIRGVSRLVEECPGAKVVFSDAIRKEKHEFLTLVYALSGGSMMGSTGLTEMAKVLAALSSRGGVRNQPMWAIQNRVLIEHQGSCPYSIRALSPSDYAVLSTKVKLADYLVELEPKRRVPDVGANEASVALWVTVGGANILLGADLEASHDARRGWKCVLCDVLPSEQAFLLKVPHHGAASGHDDDVWSRMLIPEPYALLTPFCHGRHLLPNEEDRKRVLAKTPHAYITSHPTSARGQRRRDTTVSKTIKETVRSIRSVPFSAGRIRVRFDPCDAAGATVDLANGAQRLRV